MGTVLRSLGLSLLMGLCCKIYFETLTKRRRPKMKWLGSTSLLGFTLGFLVISFTRIPPFILQPVRLILIVFIVAQIYYQLRILQNFVLTVLLCAVFWMTEIFTGAVLYALPWGHVIPEQMIEPLAIGVLVLLTLLFHFRCRRRSRLRSDAGWIRFGYLPVCCMVVAVALSMVLWDSSAVNAAARLVVIMGFGVFFAISLYFTGDILEKEEEMQNLRLSQERTRNQMAVYQNMRRSYEQQRKFLHDYKNQLTCIQGLLAEGKEEETAGYVAKLAGSLKKSADTVNANHTVVNVVLNQKYRYAEEKGIAMVLAVNDLSGLTMEDEDLVTLLVNLLDNAIEACEKLEGGKKVIQFKMVQEEEQLILSVRNPVKEPVEIRENKVVNSGKQGPGHGIGLLNVEEVIKKNHGTSTLQCRDGWFHFAAMFPVQQ